MKWNSNNPGRIEIRIFNSSLEPEIIFQNLLLVGKMFEVSLKNARNSNYKKDEFEILFLHDVTEFDKVNNLLNLLFEENKQKEIFKKRWDSVRQKRCYQQYKSGKDTFERWYKIKDIQSKMICVIKKCYKIKNICYNIL